MKKKWFLLTLVVFALYIAAILGWVSDGFTHFNYTLDDPYIHLRLARNIWHGHYGFNSTELSAPSSSILWPFLLAPFSGTSVYAFVPIVLNVFLMLLFAGTFFKFLTKHHISEKSSFLCTIFGLLAFNAVGLSLNGLEHVLQATLVLVLVDTALKGFMDDKRDIKSDLVTVVVLSIAIMVRYEMLAFWAAIVGSYILSKQIKRALLVGSLALIPVAGFSVFLESLNLGILPASVVAKTTGQNDFVKNLLGNIITNITSRPGIILLLLTLVAVALANHSKKLSLKNLWLIVVPPSLHLMVGRFGWFFRYEIYIFIYMSLLILKLIDWSKLKKKSAVLWVCFFIFVYWPYLGSVSKLRQACRNIQFQQGVTSEFINTYLREPVGVNDIGLVGFNSPYFILDLYGLASKEALDLRLNSSSFDWVSDLAKKHQVEVLFVYTIWINPNSDWVKLAEFKMTEKNIVLGDATVAMFAKRNRAEGLRQDLKNFKNVLRKYPVELTLF